MSLISVYYHKPVYEVYGGLSNEELPYIHTSVNSTFAPANGLCIQSSLCDSMTDVTNDVHNYHNKDDMEVYSRGSCRMFREFLTRKSFMYTECGG